jgi:hypothetical protein
MEQILGIARKTDDQHLEICSRTFHADALSKLREWRDSSGASPRQMSRKANTLGRQTGDYGFSC